MIPPIDRISPAGLTLGHNVRLEQGETIFWEEDIALWPLKGEQFRWLPIKIVPVNRISNLRVFASKG